MTSQAWENDKLNRRADGEHLIEVLLAKYAGFPEDQSASFILNIDASWGTGKTFFLENLRSDLQQRGHTVAYINAWQDDHSDDPLITVMAAIEQELKPFFRTTDGLQSAFDKGKKAMGVVAAESAKQLGFHLIKTMTGIGVASIMTALQEAQNGDAKYILDHDEFDKGADKVWEKSLDTLVGERLTEHQTTAKAIKTFRDQTAVAISKLPTKTTRPPFFVFIDELDRCRPLYAIKLLEEIKHLFSISGVVFVVATDSEQLSHSVRAIYGADFESRKYLRRFFDRVFVFPEADRLAFIKHLFNIHDINPDAVFYSTAQMPPLHIFKSWADGFGLSNRDLEQCMEIVATFVTSWQHPTQIEPIYLLGLVHAFYVRHDYDFQHLQVGGGIVFKEWIFTYSKFDRNRGEHRSRSSKSSELLTAAAEAMSTKLHSVEQKDDMYNAILIAERNQRFPSGVPFDALSLLNEYQSRVRNAGRVIDTNLTE